MRVCMSVFLFVYVCVCTYESLCMYLCACMQCIPLNFCVCISVCVYLWINMCVCISESLFESVCASLCLFLCVCVCVCVCVCLSLCVSLCISLCVSLCVSLSIFDFLKHTFLLFMLTDCSHCFISSKKKNNLFIVSLAKYLSHIFLTVLLQVNSFNMYMYLERERERVGEGRTTSQFRERWKTDHTGWKDVISEVLNQLTKVGAWPMDMGPRCMTS